MQFTTTVLAAALCSAAVVVVAAPTTAVSSTTIPAINNTVDTATATAAANCEKSTRYACGQYMLADGSRQDFVSQVFNCLPRDQFVCQKFDYQLSNPNHAGEASHMVAAKIDPGCSCTFYAEACDGSGYTETWDGWESEPNSPPWNRPAYTDKKFTGWWCMEWY